MQINATCNGRKSTSKKLWKKNNEGSEYNKSRSNLWGNEDLEIDKIHEIGEMDKIEEIREIGETDEISKIYEIDEAKLIKLAKLT